MNRYRRHYRSRFRAFRRRRIVRALPAPETPQRSRLIAPEWTDLIEDAPLLGDVLTITNNAAATMVVNGVYPELSLSGHGNWAADMAGRLSIDFSGFREVWALEQSVGQRHSPGYEAFGHEGERLHSLVLTSGSNEALLRQMNDLHAKTSVGQSRPEARPPAPWQSKLAGRHAWLRQTIPAETKPLPTSTLAGLLRGALGRRLPLLTSVYNEAVIHRHAWTVREAGGIEGLSLWARSDDTGLQIMPGEIGDIWCVGGTCACCGKDRWTLECFDGAQRLVLTLQCDDEDLEPEWRDLIADETGKLL